MGRKKEKRESGVSHRVNKLVFMVLLVVLNKSQIIEDWYSVKINNKMFRNALSCRGKRSLCNMLGRNKMNVMTECLHSTRYITVQNITFKAIPNAKCTIKDGSKGLPNTSI